MQHPTDTSRWSLVVHRVTQTTAQVWVGTLFPDLQKPERARVRLIGRRGEARTRNIARADWKRPFRHLRQRFYTMVEFRNLRPGREYRVEFDRRIEAVRDVRRRSWQYLRAGEFRTLPRRLPRTGEKPFTVALGSCFYDHRDGGQAAGSYRALWERGPESLRPDLSFLAGDQVYLDIGFDSLSFRSDEIRERVADDYARHWRSLGAILNRGGTWMLPDDHEFWNDYPFRDSLLPTLLALRLDRVRDAWGKAALDGVHRVQRTPPVETLALGDDLSICLADLRTYRSDRGFMRESRLREVEDWARGLSGPGVFVTPQPLIVMPNDLERNLLSFPAQYRRLVRALGASGHDIVVLTGDVHFGRIARCRLGPAGGRLIEIIASPLSNLTYLNGLATSSPRREPRRFPHASAAIEGWPRVDVEYPRDFEVETRRGRPLSAYPRRRTREHFMTIAFQRRAGGGLQLTARAFHVRERGGPRNLPVQDWARPFRTTLH